MKNYLLAVTLLLAVPAAHAADFIVLNTTSYHWNRSDVKGSPPTTPVCTFAGSSEICAWNTGTPPLNEYNLGLGYERVHERSVYEVGFYNNSVSRVSAYASYAYMLFKAQHISIGPIVDVATGYLLAPVVAMAGAEVRFDVHKFGVNLILVPTATVNGVKATGFAGLQLRYKL